MIQDIYPHVLANHYNEKAVPSGDSKVLVFREQDILARIRHDQELEYPSFARTGAAKEDCTYLFRIDETEYFFLDLAAGEELPGAADLYSEGWEFMNVRSLRRNVLEPRHELFAAMTGKHLIDWYRDTAFCGRCGTPTGKSATERAKVCPNCGYTMYPRIMPAVIVGVINGDSILITKYRTGFAHNALIAGFTEIGETLEETVAREVMEESGVRVKNITYYKSQPWGIANDILAGFYCEVDGDTQIRMDSNELKYAAWVRREDIVLQPDDFSLTNEMMLRFKEGFRL